MNEPYRTQFEVRCAFNGFCKKALKYEASSAHRDVKRYQKHFVSFSDLSPEEESQLYTVDKPFGGADEKLDKAEAARRK